MIKTALLSYWHVHAKDYAKQALAHPETELVALWDEDAARGAKEAEALNIRFESSLDALLADPDIDAVIVTVPTHMHRDVMVKAAKAGKHIFTEKVLAPTMQEAIEILDAVHASGVKLTVSLPRLNDGYTLAIQDILQQQLLGELTLVRVRLAHNGGTRGWLPEHFFNPEQTLGGAMIDLGCHPMYLTRLFLGLPSHVNASYGSMLGKAVEDNAVTVLTYENGALGIVEAGFVTAHSPFSIEIYGQDGSLLYSDADKKLLLRTNKLDEAAAKGWIEQPLKPNAASAFEQWAEHIKNGTTATENIQYALDLTLLMQASNHSAKASRAVSLSEFTR